MTSPVTIVAGQKILAADFDAYENLTAAWTSFTPTWTATGTAPALGNGTITGRYIHTGKLVIYRARLDMGSTTTYGTGTWNFSIPVAFDTSGGHVGAAYLSDATGQSYPAATAFFGSILFITANAGNVTPTVPFTWTTSDNLSWTVVYQAA
jgi:hypothetical protein